MPLQYMVSGMAVAATHKYPDETIDVAFNRWARSSASSPRSRRRRAVIERWVQEYLEATGTLEQLNAAAEA